MQPMPYSETRERESMQIPLKNTCNIDTRWGNITLVKENAYKLNSPYDNRGKRYVLPGGGRATREDIEAYGKRTKFEVVFPC